MNTIVYAGTGFNGNGMIFGTLSGKIISDMILKKENRYEGLYSPSRIKPLAGFVSFVEENVDVAKQFISKRFSYEQIDELVKLSNDEAKLVEYKGKRMALYKDDNGELHALDPVCPHAGCIVVWNNAEKTWDCPCHGARYAMDGRLLNGPSIKGLSKVAIYET
jgi:Rieske Fe-S protein